MGYNTGRQTVGKEEKGRGGGQRQVVRGVNSSHPGGNGKGCCRRTPQAEGKKEGRGRIPGNKGNQGKAKW